VRAGMANAYYTCYEEDMRTYLDECVQSCDTPEGCPVIISGSSQGGGVATVGELALHTQNLTPLARSVHWLCVTYLVLPTHKLPLL